MPFVTLSDAELHYESSGTGEPLLLVSGLSGNAAWEPQVSEFSKHYRVIVHDQRGSGRSTKSKIRYSVGQITQDTMALMDALEIKSANILGHSLGAAVAQTMAIEHPERVKGLILASGWAKTDAFLNRTMAARRQILVSGGPEAYVSASAIFMYPPVWINQNERALEISDQHAVASFVGTDIVRSRIDAVLEFNSAEKLGSIKAKTLVIVAADDVLTPTHFSVYLKEHIARSTLSVLDYGAHRMSHVSPDVFNSKVLEFLRSQGNS